METVVPAEPYPRLRRRLAFTRLRQAARSACDLTGLGPSVAGRLCCALILGAVLFGGTLILSFLIGLSPSAAVTVALTAFLLVLSFGSLLVLFASDADLASGQEQLLRELPSAKVAWLAYKERLRAERVARRERLRNAAAPRSHAGRGRIVADGKLPGPGTYEIEVVGESHHQRELERICGGRSEEGARVKTTAVLVLDDNNPYDSQAVRVEIHGYVVGHLSRENARQYRKRLEEAGHAKITASCKALIVGGWDRGNGDRGDFGVRLDLPAVEDPQMNCGVRPLETRGMAETGGAVDKRHLLPSLVHPKQAKVGDYVFVWAVPGSSSIEIVQVSEVTRNGYLRVEGRDQCYRRGELLPPTEHRKQQYLEGLRLAAYPVVGEFTPADPLPKFPPEPKTSPHVVGRPELAMTNLEVSRSPSDYLDIRFSLRNDGGATVALGEYQWEENADLDRDRVPFAYLGDERYKVFQVEGGGKLYPRHVAHYRVVVSKWAGVGNMRLFIPSGILGGAIGTYTMLVFDTPPVGTAGA
jgi:hypothetical protein